MMTKNHIFYCHYHYLSLNVKKIFKRFSTVTICTNCQLSLFISIGCFCHFLRETIVDRPAFRSSIKNIELFSGAPVEVLSAKVLCNFCKWYVQYLSTGRQSGIKAMSQSLNFSYFTYIGCIVSRKLNCNRQDSALIIEVAKKLIYYAT